MTIEDLEYKIRHAQRRINDVQKETERLALERQDLEQQIIGARITIDNAKKATPLSVEVPFAIPAGSIIEIRVKK